ncbi:MAG: hypothetical protein GF398_09405 [Chitinivibrionales bacterium]|nr:hypothetical protein [Chitinivibrionales bacterium]
MHPKTMTILRTVLVCATYALLTHAQTGKYGVIAGMVRDTKNSPLRGVTVEAVTPALMVIRSELSTSNGSFVLYDIPDAQFFVRFHFSGFPAQYWAPGGTTHNPSDSGLIPVSVDDTVYLQATLQQNPSGIDTTGYYPSIPPGNSHVLISVKDTNFVFEPAIFELDLIRVPDSARMTAIRDVSGLFRFEWLAQGRYVIHMPPQTPYPEQYYHPTQNTIRPGRVHMLGHKDTLNITLIATQTPLPDGILSGVVQDNAHNPHTDATVELYPAYNHLWATNTLAVDANGRFFWTALQDYSYYIKVSLPNYPQQWYHPSGNTEVPEYVHFANSDSDLTIVPSTSPGQVATLLKLEIQQPNAEPAVDVSEVTLVRQTDGYKVNAPATPSTAGRFEKAGLPGGRYALRIRSASYPEQFYDPGGNTAFARFFAAIDAGDTLSVTTNLLEHPYDPGAATLPQDTAYRPSNPTAPLMATISGKVVSQVTQSPLSGATVVAIPRDDLYDYMSYTHYWGPHFAYTDSSGRYTLSVNAGEYAVYARTDTMNLIAQFYDHVDKARHARMLTLTDSTQVSMIGFNLRAGGTLRGTITSNGVGLAGVEVFCAGREFPFHKTANTDTNGTYLITGLPKGRYFLNAQSYDYFTAPGAQNHEYEIVEGTTTSANEFEMNPGGRLAGAFTQNTNSTDSLIRRREFQIRLFPVKTPVAGEVVHDEWITQARNFTSQTYLSDVCPAGSYQAVFSPLPVSDYDFAAVGNKSILPWTGWTVNGAGSSIAASPSLTLNAGDTTAVNATLRPGYSILGTFRTQNGEFNSTQQPYSNFSYSIDVFHKIEGAYYKIADIRRLQDGRWEMPGLVDGDEYYFKLHCDGYPEQWWAPSYNSHTPDSAWTFDASAYQPLDIVAVANPAGYYQQSHGHDPLAVHADYVNSQPTLTITAEKSLMLDTLALYSMNHTGVIETLLTTAYQTGQTPTYTETRSLTNTYYRYTAVGKSDTLMVRSRPVDGDFRNLLALPAESLWINPVADLNGGVQIFWGAGTTYQPQKEDSVKLIRRTVLPTQSNWQVRMKDFAVNNMLFDHDWDAQGDSGKVFEYQVELTLANGKSRRSPVKTFSISPASAAAQPGFEFVTVGPGEAYTTIQSAVNAIPEIGTIQIAAGIYRENVVIRDKMIFVQGDWRNGKPPILDGNGATALTMHYAAPGSYRSMPEIAGLKFQNSQVAIKTYASVSVSHCLFVNNDIAVQANIDSAAMSQSLITNPFLPSENHINIRQCTFIGKTSSDLVGRFNARGLSETPGYSNQWDGWEEAVLSPVVSLKNHGHFNNCIFSSYAYPDLPLVFRGKQAGGYLENSIFWETSTNLIQANLHVDSSLHNLNPHFVDSSFYIVPDNSKIHAYSNNGAPFGYSEYDHNYGSSPDDIYIGPVTNLTRTITGFNSVSLAWGKPAGTDSITRYMIVRLDATDTAIFYVNDGQWDVTIDEDSFPVLASTSATQFTDTTARLNTPYLYVVIAMDNDSNDGDVDLPYPPALSSYLTTIGYTAFAKQSAKAMKADSWHMLGAWGADTLSLPAGTGRFLYHWDDAKPADNLYSQYVASTTLEPGKGYWIRSDSDTSLHILKSSFNNLSAQPAHFSMTLQKGRTGWHQIASPYPFKITPAWLQKFDTYAWNSAKNGYREATELNPWEAVWIHVERDTTLTFSPGIPGASGNSLAKAAAAYSWKLQVGITGETSEDMDNYIGVIKPALAKQAHRHSLEPPPAFDFPQLYFVNNDAPQSADEAIRLSRHYKVANAAPEQKLEWQVGLSAAQQTVRLSIIEKSSLPRDVHLFWATKDTIRNLRALPELTIAPHADEHFGYIVASANAWEIALYQNRFLFKSSFPNPFRTITSLQFALPYAWQKDGSKKAGESRSLSLRVYNMQGRLVRTLVDGKKRVGIHRLIWDGLSSSGRNIPAGYYFARLQSGSFDKTVKMIKVR